MNAFTSADTMHRLAKRAMDDGSAGSREEAEAAIKDRGGKSPGSVSAKTFAVVVGTVVSKWYETRIRNAVNRERAERLGTLVASGLIVGESLWGVFNAGLIVAFSKDAPLALVPEDFPPAKILGVLGFVGVIVWLYGWMLRRTAKVAR